MSQLLLKVKFHKPTINKTVFKVKAILKMYHFSMVLLHFTVTDVYQ